MDFPRGPASPRITQRAGASSLLASAGVAAALGLTAAATGASYALVSYAAADTRLVPIAAAALVALGIGLWRLEYGLALLIVVTPFAENASIGQPGEAKLRLALILWAVVLVGIQAGRVLVTEHRLVAPSMSTGAGVFLVAALLAVAVASDEQEAMSKFLLLVGSVVIYLLIGLFLRDWARLKPLLGAFLAVGLLIGAHTLYQYVTGDLSEVGFANTAGTIEYRVASFFPHPNQLAGFLVLFVPLGFGLFSVLEQRLAKAASLLLVALAVLGVLATYSRGGLIALAGLALIYARHRRAWPVVAAALALVVWLAPSVWETRLAGTSSLDSPEIATRLDLWGAAGEIFQEYPALGVGLNNFPGAYIALEQSGRSFLPGTSFGVPETAHNLYLNTLAEQGLLGAAALLLLILSAGRMILALRRSADRRTRAMGEALLGVGVVLLVHNLFDVTFLDSKTSTVVWALLGIGAALHGNDIARQAEQRSAL